MNNYANEQSILRDDKVLESLCRAYKQAVRVGANETAHSIRSRTMEIYQFSSNKFSRFVKAAHSCLVSRRSKLKRLESRIRKFYEEGESHFVTITWNDDALCHNTAATRKRFVRSTLNDVCWDFVANVDYGKKYHREHYHAVTLGLDVQRLRNLCRPYGFIKVEKVIPKTESTLSMYVDKLCNHALKETTCKTLMYCRKKNKIDACICISEYPIF